MKEKHKLAHMRTAFTYAECSSAVRLKVGAIVVKDDRIVSIGYNGTPKGWDNCCEYREYDLSRDFNGDYFPESQKQYPHTDEYGRYRLKTKPEVLHAEMNALMKLARSSESGEDSTLFVTHSPCIDCAKGIYQAGIRQVYYSQDYRDNSGIEFLEKCGIAVEKINV